jgi:hypothetical protein
MTQVQLPVNNRAGLEKEHGEKVNGTTFNTTSCSHTQRPASNVRVSEAPSLDAALMTTKEPLEERNAPQEPNEKGCQYPLPPPSPHHAHKNSTRSMRHTIQPTAWTEQCQAESGGQGRVGCQR